MVSGKKYDAETRARAVRLYWDRLGQGDVTYAQARGEVAPLVGVNAETLRKWIYAGEKMDVSLVVGDDGSLAKQNARLRREVVQLREANEILKTASAFFAAAELDRKLGR